MKEEGGGTDTDRFKRMQKIEGRERAESVFCRSTDFTIQSVVSSCFTGVQNENEKPKDEYNSSPLNC